MANKQIKLLPEQMRRIARYEISFRDMIDDLPIEDISFVCPEPYRFTLDDLYHAVKALKAADPAVRDFSRFWFGPLFELSAEFGIGPACGAEEGFDDVPEELKGYPGLKVSESGYFSDVWLELEAVWEFGDDEMRFSSCLDLETIISDLERFFENRGKPIEQWRFSAEEKENYIGCFDDDGFVAEASEPKLALARKFIEELCEKDSVTALYVKGYACYGGNRLYPCDWNVSRDCMLALFAETDDPQYANTLGYIYYYGRCTDGVPEYDKAFYYFGIAAANGLYESIYKLADMFRSGCGCRESKRTARSLYGMVYEENMKRFLKGENVNFADTALRMGNVFAKGIGEETDLTAAYFYYLQADHAAHIRAKDSDFFGHTTVAINARRALEETEAKLPKGFFKKRVCHYRPFLFAQLAGDNNRCVLSRSTGPEGRVELTGERIPTRSVPDPEAILLTIPELKLCRRTKTVSYTMDKAAEIWFKDDAERVKYDFCATNADDGQYEFYYDDELVARVKADKYILAAETTDTPSGPEYLIASVCFDAGGRSYDYICEFEDVQPGDVVIVEGYDGETEVTVTKIAVRNGSELSIPAEKYKKVLRRG